MTPSPKIPISFRHSTPLSLGLRLRRPGLEIRTPHSLALSRIKTYLPIHHSFRGRETTRFHVCSRWAWVGFAMRIRHLTLVNLWSEGSLDGRGGGLDLPCLPYGCGCGI